MRSELPGKGTTFFEYDSAGDLRRKVEPSGLVVTYTYDALGRPLTEIQTWTGGSATTDRTYDPMGNVLTETAPAAVDTTATPVATRRQRATNVYDKNNNGVSTTISDVGGSVNPAAPRTTTFEHDDADRVVLTRDPIGGTSTRAFDPNGNVARVTDAAGRVHETIYDSLDRPIELRLLNFRDDPIGGSAPRTMVLRRWQYDLTGRQISEARPQPGTGGRSGQLSPESTPMSERWTAYDKADRALSVTLRQFDNRPGVSPSSRDVVLSAYLYDDAGNRALETNAGWLKVSTYSFDAANRVQTIATPVDGVTRVVEFDYDELGNQTRTTVKPAGGAVTSETRAAFDTAGRMTSETVENGATDLVTTYTYDERGLKTSSVEPRGNAAGANPANFRTDFTYTATGLAQTTTGAPISVEENGGASTTVRPVVRFGYDALGNLVTTVDARGNRTTSTYDLLNRETRIDHPKYKPANSSAELAPFETFAYDAVGNVVSRTDRRGHTTNYDFDADNRVVRRRDPLLTGQTVRGDLRSAYDDAGNLVETTDPVGARTAFAYDDMARLRTRTDVVRQAAPAGSFTTTYDYDDLGNPTFRQDPTGIVQRSAFNAASELVSQTDARDAVTAFTYDTAGRPVATTDALGRTEMNVYDLAGRVTSAQSRSGGPTGAVLSTEFAEYDLVGNVVAKRSARSASATDNTYLRSYTYDAANRLTSATEPNSTTGTFTTSFRYDASGNLTRSTDGRGATSATIFKYNAWNLRTETVEPSTPGQTSVAMRTFTTSYDKGGLPVEEAQPGATIKRTFDELGRLRVEDGTGSSLTAATRAFAYDLAGRQTSVNHPTGPITFAYDDRGLLLAASEPGNATPQSSFEYDPAGRMKARTDAAGTTSFQHDDRGDLWKITDPLTTRVSEYVRDPSRAVSEIRYGTTSVRQIGYDNRGRIATDVLKTGNPVRSSYTYSYDADGNVTGQNVVMPGNASAGNHTYTYDRAGRLGSWKKPGAAAVTYTYDAAGNRLSEATTKFVYDRRNRLTTGPDGKYTWSTRGTMTQGRTADGAALAYTFDALGRQTAVGTTTYTYDGLDRLAKRGSTAVVYAGAEIDPVRFGAETYARSPAGELVAAQKDSTTTFVGENRHGDISWYLDTNGATWGSALYDPWGEPMAAGESTTLGFQGDVTDATTGQSWMGARWYDPAIGGFTARDTVFGLLETPVSLNRYTYAHNDPMQYFDPDGRWPGEGIAKNATKAVKKTWNNTGGKVVTGVDKYVVKPAGRAAKSTTDAAKSVLNTTYRAGDRAVRNAANTVKKTVTTAVNTGVRYAKNVGSAIAAPIKACIGSETCRTIVAAAAVVTATVVCAACTGAVLAGGAIGGAFGVATCDGDLSCIAQSTVAGAAGGLFAPVGGAGLLATVGSSAASGFVATGASQFMNGRFDAKQLAFGTFTGAAAGGVFHSAGRGLAALRGRGSSVPDAPAGGAAGELRPASAQPRGGNGTVLRDGAGATPEEVAASRGGPTGGSRAGQADRHAEMLQETQDAGGLFECWRCGQTSRNPDNMHVGHRNVSTSKGGNLDPVNTCWEGAACNLGAGNRGGPNPGRSCAERGSCGAPYGRSD